MLISSKLICHSIITNMYHFLKEQKENFKCININCHSSLRFVADISKKNAQKDTIFDDLRIRTVSQEGDMKTRQK